MSRNDSIKTVLAFDPDRPNLIIVDWLDGVQTVYDLANVEGDGAARMKHHGGKQKYMDSHAGGIKEYGSVEGCRAKTEATVEHVEDGDWFAARSGAGKYIYEALAAVFKTDAENAKEVYDNADKETQAKMSRDPRITEWNAKRLAKRAAERAKTATPSADIAKMFA